MKPIIQEIFYFLIGVVVFPLVVALIALIIAASVASTAHAQSQPYRYYPGTPAQIAATNFALGLSPGIQPPIQIIVVPQDYGPVPIINSTPPLPWPPLRQPPCPYWLNPNPSILYPVDAYRRQNR